MSSTSSSRYRFGDSTRASLLLGLSVRQSVPLVAGVLWLTLWLMAGVPIVGLVGPAVGVVFAFGRWRNAPLFDIAAPGLRLWWTRRRNRSPWVKSSLLGEGHEHQGDLPGALLGLEMLDVSVDWHAGRRRVAVVRDRHAGSVSAVMQVTGSGFAVASLREQDGLVAGWGGAIGPLARAQCPVSRITWQEWAHPIGVSGHRIFLDGLDRPMATRASNDYDALLDLQAPFTTAHEVLLTLAVDLRRVRARRRQPLAAAIDTLVDEARLLASRLESAGLRVDGPLSPLELSTAIRLRSDPSRSTQVASVRRSLAAAVGRGVLEWGPMVVDAKWDAVSVDGSVHRSFRVAGWPMLPVGADWMAPLLAGEGATRTVTVVLEPVPLHRAAADANRQLTSIEADHAQKERHGFRLTARERRRQADVETRERELAEGHPEFRHAAIVTVTASGLDELDDACARVEQAAAQSMLDLRPLAARQAEGWAASLPMGRSFTTGARA
ncbi:MAG: hypothetical protein Q7V57_18430 [Actinomycetota bacterium]|nr:hypothetical protein [Actinomycetota bacterium]